MQSGRGDLTEALMRAARWFLKRSESEEAVSLYAAGIAVATVGPEDNMTDRLSRACLLMAFHIRIEASGQERMYEEVINQLNDSYEGIGEHLRELIDLARQYVTESSGIE